MAKARLIHVHLRLMLNIALQAGDSYEDLDPGVRDLVDLLLPEYTNQIRSGFLSRARRDYEKFTRSTPDVTFPSFDDVLDNPGPLGPLVQNYRQLQQDIRNSEQDYQSIMTSLLELEDTNRPLGSGETPWSVLDERVYARLLTEESCRDISATGALQIRVLPSNRVLQPDPVDVPIMGIFGDPRDKTFAPIIGIPRLPEEL